MRYAPCSWGFVGLLAVAAACRSAPPAPLPRLTADDAELFGNAVEYIGDPKDIGHEWTQSWLADLDARLRRADLIATVKVRSVDMDAIAGESRWVRLQTQIDETLWGQANMAHLELPVHGRDAGFVTVEGKDEQILKRSWLALVAWYRVGDDGAKQARWTLYPASSLVMQRSATVIAARQRPSTSH